eukprot:1357231-Rhodomonas_salina.1
MQQRTDTDTAYHRSAMDLPDKQSSIEQLARTPDAQQIDHEHGQRVAIDIITNTVSTDGGVAGVGGEQRDGGEQQ